MDKDNVHLDDVLRDLKEEGLNPIANAEERLSFLWTLYLGTKTKLRAATNSLEELREQQAEEMKEVENYVAHIRSLTEEREVLTTDCEKENIQLRIELEKLQVQQESQLKEVEEMLDQEGLNEIAHSSPSEQVAYLLVERATLLEKLEILEQKLDSQLESLSDGKRQEELECIHQTLEEELQQQRESMKRTKETLNKELPSSAQNPWKKLFGIRRNADGLSADSSTYDEELDKEKKRRECVERDLDEAARRLQMAHEEIRRLTDDLLIKRKEVAELEHILQKNQQETNVLKHELQTVQENDSLELQKSQEHNNRLDREILALRTRVRSLDSDRKKYMEQNEKSDSESIGKPTSDQQNHFQDNEVLHKRCQLEVEERDCVNKELLHKLHKLQSEHEETVERNEELESILGEAQNRTKEQTDSLECEIAGLQRTIMSLEAELSKLRKREEESCAVARGGNTEIKKMADLLEIIRSQEENVEMLESKLIEEREWRQQLELDLETAQKALRDDKVELHLAKSNLKEVQKEMTIRKVAEQETNILCIKNEQLAKEKCLQDNKISELAEECKRLQLVLSEQKATNEIMITRERICKQLEEKIQSLENEMEARSGKLSEYKKKCEILQKQIHEGMEENKNLWEETLQLRQDVQGIRQELQTKREENARLKQEMGNVQEKMQRPQSCGDGAEEIVSQYLAGDALIQQQHEEIRQLRQDLHRVQHLCSAAEKELRYERDKNLDFKKQHIFLQQENTKVSAELNQVKQKLSGVTTTCSILEAEMEKSRQRVKEMELELLKQSQTSKVQYNWQDKLEHEKCKALIAEKQVLELQQQLRACQHQVLLLETQVVERKQLEDEAKKARENGTKLRAQLHEEQIKSKRLDQNCEDLQKQIKTLHDKESLLSQNNSALQFKLHQQESRLRILDDEHNATAKERLYRENNNQKLSEDLSQMQQEKERLHKEYDNVLKQLDEYVRKYNEKQLRHKAKLCRAKEVHINEVNQRDMCIQQLEMQIALCRSQAEKEQQWINKITAENEHLHGEKRHLLQKMNEQEAVERNNTWKLLSAQNRAHILDEENKQLQEIMLQLYNQIGSLERVLKKIEALNLEDIKKMIPSECLLLSDSMLHLPKGRAPIFCYYLGSLGRTKYFQGTNEGRFSRASDRKQ
ncbi:coiled-coil domain-containing protein 30 isoform X2 [Ascaphus truei]|uniref:coiled-coil domain-containing protein 30 isoform X2 n=1 Tax=Ascaphus truei TaxID=8439 RepID=UPI003F5A721E